jgi:hypothetical protein
MSTTTPPASQRTATPIAQELNKEDDYDAGDGKAVGVVVSEYTDIPPEKQRGRPILSQQIPQPIAEKLLTEFSLTPLYSHSRETESVTAWKVGETTKALLRCDEGSTNRGSWYMLPSVGEARLDLRWLMLQSIHRDINFTIEYLTEETIKSILKITRPEHRVAIEKLLRKLQTGSADY